MNFSSTLERWKRQSPHWQSESWFEPFRPRRISQSSPRAGVRGRSRAMGDDEDSEEPYVYSSKPGGSSMYAAVERVLAARPDWTSASSASSFDLLIAERWAIPHTRLGRDGFGGTPSRVPMTNHARGSKAITVKGMMVKSLRALSETVHGANVADFLPETYLVTPGEASDAAERAALLRVPRADDECWICKPTGGAHGVGIEICRDARDALRQLYLVARHLVRAGVLKVLHLRTLLDFGARDRAPDGRVRAEQAAARLWDEALDRMSTVLRRKGILA